MSNKNELYINGMTNKVDTINSIIDNIDNNDLDTAKDSLNQLKEVEEKELYGTKEESPLDDLHEALNPNNSYKLVESK
jgi:hypothetical protein